MKDEGDISKEISAAELFKPGAVGWVLAIIFIFIAGGLIWNVTRTLKQGRGKVLLGGPGAEVSEYGFDVSVSLVDRDLIVPSGISRDGLQTLDNPLAVAGSSVKAINKEMRGKFLVPGDRVIGVVINGQARAWPLPVMNWHEVSNDTLGGTPIVVTYHPLCDSVRVFERTIEGEVLSFGVSGLLYNSNHLLFDRGAKGGHASLFSPLRAQAICGPAADRGVTLKTVPATLARWSDWLSKHPDTTVVRGLAEQMGQSYKMNPYGVYYNSPTLKYPVEPTPPEDGPRAKERCVIVADGESRTVFTEKAIAALTGGAGEAPVPVGSRGLTFRYTPGEGAAIPVIAVLDENGEMADGAYYALWFAWHAAFPGDPLYSSP